MQELTPERDSAVVDGSNSVVDYSAIDLPNDKPRSEWHYTHRRAELLQLIEEAGHPDDLNQTELAEKFDVSQQQISKDIRRLGAFVREELTDPDRRTLTIDAVVNRSIRGLLDEGDFRKAAQTALEYDEWVSERIEAEEFRRRLDQLEDMADRQGGSRHG